MSNQKRSLAGFFKIAGSTLLIVPVWSWTSLRFCYWHGEGWCADVQPIVDWQLTGLVAFLAVGLIARFLKARWPDASVAMTSAFIVAFGMGVAGWWFSVQENRRAEMVEASANGDAALIARALENGCSPNATASRRGPSALYQTVTAQSVPAAQKLLEAGADPDGKHHGCSIYHPLSKAYMNGDAAMASLLKKYRASTPCPETQRLLIEKYGVRPDTFTTK